MACSTLAGRALYSNSWCVAWPQRRPGESAPTRLVVKAVDSNVEEDAGAPAPAPAPENEVSLGWKAAERSPVYPPSSSSNKKWTGYVEKDTAGQTNIYAVEPTVYVSENAISSNTAGDSLQGSEQTLTVALGLALGLLVGAGVVLQWVSPSAQPTLQQQQPQPPPAESAATLTYYIQKFSSLVQQDAPPSSSSSSVVESSASPSPTDQDQLAAAED